MRIMVTGDRGFVGSYLVPRLKRDGHTVRGFDLPEWDLRNKHDVFDALDQIKPEKIFHLGAQTCVPASFEDPVYSIMTNTIGTLNLLEALRLTGFDGHVHLAGTSEEYGYDHTYGPLSECSPTLPTTPYGVGKLAATSLGMVYARRYGLHVVVTRAANHIGAGQQGGVVADWAKQIIEIERGDRKELRHGDLEVQRSFMDVRDVVDAYMRVIDLDPGVYNIGPDHAYRLGDILNTMIHLTESVIPLVDDPELARPTEVKKFMLMSVDNFWGETGWKPRHELQETLSYVMNWWRKNIDHEVS